jgi:hypothetical protein
MDRPVWSCGAAQGCPGGMLRLPACPWCLLGPTIWGAQHVMSNWRPTPAAALTVRGVRYGSRTPTPPTPSTLARPPVTWGCYRHPATHRSQDRWQSWHPFLAGCGHLGTVQGTSGPLGGGHRGPALLQPPLPSPQVTISPVVSRAAGALHGRQVRLEGCHIVYGLEPGCCVKCVFVFTQPALA